MDSFTRSRYMPANPVMFLQSSRWSAAVISQCWFSANLIWWVIFSKLCWPPAPRSSKVELAASAGTTLLGATGSTNMRLALALGTIRLFDICSLY